MKIWIVWLPNVWKSTLFNALTKSYSAPAQNFPFCTIEPNIGIVNVKDNRLDNLAEVFGAKDTIYANIKFVDIAWLVKWASQWEWLGNKFLSHIREVDAIVHVVRYFEDEEITHVHGKVDPIDDAEVINAELMIADLEQIEKTLTSLEKTQRRTKEQDLQLNIYRIAKDHLDRGKFIHTIRDELSIEEKKLLGSYNFITDKPMIYAVNVSENDLSNYRSIEDKLTNTLNRECVVVSAKLENELMELDESEKTDYIISTVWSDIWLEDLPTLDRLIKKAFDTVGLMYYFTAWEKECRAWTIHRWWTWPQAAWVIHTDFEKWYIRAEVVNYNNIILDGSRANARSNWHLRIEGKDYVVQDGDVMLFRFNV